MHSRSDSHTDVENETNLVLACGRRSHDQSDDAAFHGGADGRENPLSSGGPFSDVHSAESCGGYHLRGSAREDFKREGAECDGRVAIETLRVKLALGKRAGLKAAATKRNK